MGYIWKHSPGSVAGIQAATYYHMSLKNENGFRIMGAGFVNPISKKKNKITTLTTIKKLLTTPLNTGLLPKKMGPNFIFKIRVFSKIRCSDKQLKWSDQTQLWQRGFGLQKGYPFAWLQWKEDSNNHFSLVDEK